MNGVAGAWREQCRAVHDGKRFDSSPRCQADFLSSLRLTVKLRDPDTVTRERKCRAISRRGTGSCCSAPNSWIVGNSYLGISSCLPVNNTGREPHPVEIASEPAGMSHARFDRSERGSTEVYERVGPSRNAYFVGMQKQRLLPSGSVTANSRSPQV